MLLWSVYVWEGMPVQEGSDEFQYKYNWRFSNRGDVTSLFGLEATDYQMQLAVL